MEEIIVCRVSLGDSSKELASLSSCINSLSMPRLYDEEPRSIFIIPNPFRALSHKARQIGVYAAGVLVCIQWPSKTMAIFAYGEIVLIVCTWLVGVY